MNVSAVLRAFALFLLTAALATPPAHAQETQVGTYLATVKRYADAMIEHGRDSYGEVQSPLFASALDRTTMRIPEEVLPAIEGIREGDRALFGGNPMHDECFYMLLYELTPITGDRRYKDAADAALEYFLTRAQSPATGLFAWGEHMYLDFRTETMGGRDIHEFYRPWILFDESYALAPEPMNRFARGLWYHQVGDLEHGYFSRHATWSAPKADTGNEFPRHGGFYMAQWAEAYKRTGAYIYLGAIETLLNYFERVRHSESGALPNVHPGGDKKVVIWTESQLAQAIELADGAGKVPPDLGARMLETARRNDASYLKLAHSDKGMVDTASYEKLEPEAYASMWASGYGAFTNAGTAMLCYERYLQCKNEAYRTLMLDVAQRYLASEPDTSIELYPYVMGDAIFLMVAAHRLTDDAAYLERGRYFADTAIPLFWNDGPLPRASTKTNHYEAVTRADTLSRALLLLWGELNDRNLETRYIDR